MKKLWLVFAHEYTRRVKSRGFIFAVLSMPLLVVLAIALSVVSVSMLTSKLPAGYVDLSGRFTHPQAKQSSGFEIARIDLIPYSDVESGKGALSKDQIQALFVIQPDYLKSGNVIVYANDTPGENAYSRMQDFLADNLLAGESAAVKTRVEKGSNFTVSSLDGSRQASMRDWFVVLFPFPDRTDLHYRDQHQRWLPAAVHRG